jgi:hypothetical protein
MKCKPRSERFHHLKISRRLFHIIVITNAVDYILQHEVLTKTERCKMPTALVIY